MNFQNSPQMKDEQNGHQIKRYVHQPLAIEHFGIHAKIQPNGKVIITSPPVKIAGTDEIEYDEVEIPASLVFKLASLLKATRTVTFVDVAEVKSEDKE